MTVTTIDKDSDALTLTLVAAFAAPVDAVWELFPSIEQMEEMLKMGMEEGLRQAVGQMDGLLE